MKKVLITGVSGGLGLCLAAEFAGRNYCVYGYDIDNNERIKQLQADFPEQFEYFQMDIRNDESVTETGKILRQKTGSLDIIVNAAAVLPPNSANLLENFDISGSLEVFSTNSLGPLRIVKDLLPLIKKGEDKMIINISSEAGSMTTHCDYINRYDYCMSKAALNIQSIILQRYLRPEGIKVLLIHPGWVRTGMGGKDAPVLPSESAEGIVKLAEKYRHTSDTGMFYDYDGSTRAW